MISCKADNVETIEYIESINITLEDKGGNSIVSSNRADIKLDRQRGKEVDFFSDTSLVEVFSDDILFSGEYLEEKKSEKNVRTSREIRVFDRLKEVSKLKFAEDEIYLGRSFIWLLGTLFNKLGLSVYGISITDDFNINYAYWKKGDKIIDEVKELLEATNGRLYTDKSNIVRFVNGIDNIETTDSGVTFNESNLQREVEIEVEKAEYEKIRVEYDSYTQLANQTVFQLANDKVINANSSGTLLCNYVSSACMNIALKKILITNANGDTIIKKGVFVEDGVEVNYDVTNSTVTFTTDFQQNKTKLVIENTNDFEVFLTDFELSGEPLVKHEGNWLEYAAEETEAEADTVKNKYIQNSDAALALAKARYREKCNDIEKYRFTSSVVTDLDILQKATIHNEALNIQSTQLIIRKLQYSIKRKSLHELKVEAEKYADFTYPASPWIKIEEVIGSNSLEQTAVNETSQDLTNQVNSLITEIVDDTGTTENVYEIAVNDYIHSAKPLIRFFAGKANTGPAILKINGTNEYTLKKLGYLLDLESGDIAKDMIVLCNFNSRKNVYEVLNTVGLENTIQSVAEAHGFAYPLAVVEFTNVDSYPGPMGTDFYVELNWEDPNLNLIEEFTLRRKKTPWQVPPYGTDETSGTEVLSGTADDLNSYTDTNNPLVDVVDESGTFHYKMFYKVSGNWQYSMAHNNLEVQLITNVGIMWDEYGEYYQAMINAIYLQNEAGDVWKMYDIDGNFKEQVVSDGADAERFGDDNYYYIIPLSQDYVIDYFAPPYIVKVFRDNQEILAGYLQPEINS